MSPPNDAARRRAEMVLLPDTAAQPSAAALPLPDGAPTASSLPRARLRRRFADALYIILMSAGWLGLNVLAVAGCAVVAFAMLGGGDWAATFMQIDNLTSRYLEADAGRRAQFQHHLVQVFSTVLLALVVFRLPCFIKRVRRDLAAEDLP